MKPLFKNAFAKWFLLLLLAQQGLGSLALAAAGAMQDEHNRDAAAMAHECADMLMLDLDSPESSAVTRQSSEHDHQDCADMGCDNCVGCAVCAVNYRHSPSLDIRALPMVAAVTVAIPSSHAERLYRPPIIF
jgi:hypothetical protein